MAKQSEQSKVRRELVSKEIFEQAARLFAERGVSRTSLQEVADALGISRTALYHYIGGKDDLLATLVRGLTGETADSLEALVADGELTPLQRLRAAVHSMCMRIAGNPSRFRLLLISENELDEPLAAKYRDARRRTLAALTQILEEGVRAGVLRQADPRTAAFAIFGACNWIAWWYRPERETELTPENLAESMTEFAVSGLQAQAGRAPEGEDPVTYAIALMREDLVRMERAVEEGR